ncbi:MAG: adenylosuccinate lyase [Bacteroidetes bacterium]|nr:adenylosuccinate lyase [Bacteroidota bacterium]MDA0972809.1 adenylosuccinate lyase [Bacteroidota bacterium]
MQLSALSAIGPMDGRYRDRVQVLSDYFSEYALIRYRLLVELRYFKALCAIPLPQLANVDPKAILRLEDLMATFSEKDAQSVKEKEKVTNHDVKAVEYLLKEWMEEVGLGDVKEFVHFGLTSQDVNNTAIPLSLKEAMLDVYLPNIESLIEVLKGKAMEWSEVPMLARTHGQAASPTRLGKEVTVFIERLKMQLSLLHQVPYSAKFGGATGNFNAHHIAYPQVNWPHFADTFCDEALGLMRSKVTTQVEHYDNLAALFDTVSRINVILIDLCRDFWTYVSMDYFKQVIRPGEIGSSAMPHKVNPIDFENAEGNLGVANAIFHHLSSKLPISRLQRDLTDSTVLRNLGVPFAHTLLSIQSITIGLSKLLLNRVKLEKDLEDNWAVVAEAIQTILRRENYPNPYEALKTLTRKNERVTEETMKDFIQSLDISDALKQELFAIRPETYTGY